MHRKRGGSADAGDGATETPESATSAELVYVSDDEPGIRRLRNGMGFKYQQGGKRVRDRRTLQRIHSLAIPPAWTDVWICRDGNGHLQATGRDARVRKQYLYHQTWREARDATKFDHILEFAEALPGLRRRVRKDMRRRGIPREKVLATIVNLLDVTLIRVGNADYARQNHSYGLTTLRDRHVAVEGSELRLEFKGKSGKSWRLKLRDRRIARAVKDCQDIPGQHLFQYFDEDGGRHPLTSSDVNAYLREISGTEITAKDFRTWAGTVLAATALCALDPAESETDAKRNIRAVIADVAARLGNTPAICRKCYVHPELLESYRLGSLVAPLKTSIAKALKKSRSGLDAEEAAVLAFLRRCLARTREKPERLAA